MATKKSDQFGAKMKRLEKIVVQLESEALDLEKAVALFEEGVKLSKECEKRLNAAQKKIEILLEGENGEVEAKTFDPALDEDEPEL